MLYGIIGYGIVGKATHQSFLKNETVCIHDIAHGTTLEQLKNCDVAFFCTPTSNNDDLNQLVHDINNFEKINPSSTIILRSTVPVGYCSKISKSINNKIMYMPEFLRERYWNSDCNNRPLIVGINDNDIPLFLTKEDCIFCTYEEAEIVKMFSNNFSAIKIVFANHFYDISTSFNTDYNKILEYYDKIEHKDQSYLEVTDNLRGFGGKCLPKDLDFLIQSFKSLDLAQNLFSALKEDNKKWPTTIKEF